MKVVFLGSGNIATHLGRAFKLSGLSVEQVWSRQLDHAAELADALASQAISDLEDVSHSADLYVISVKDEVIRDIALRLKLTDKLIVHTSGSTGLEALEGASSRIGSFYPLQTFSKNRAVDFRNIPVAIEANSPEDTAFLRSIAERFSEKVITLDSEQRRALHVAAVFACNFTNHLYAISEGLLKDAGLEFDLLKPLIAETADRIMMYKPQEVQTGPAVRGDQSIINAHIAMLEEENPEYMELYRKLSQSIVNLHEPSEGSV